MKKFLITLLLLMISPVYAADIQEMAGQLIMVGFVGNKVKSKGFKTVLRQLDNNQITGVIFFEDNIKNKDEFKKMTNAVKNSKAKHKPLIAIDMEGGIIQRMNSKNGFEDFKTAKEVSKLTENEAYIEYDKLAKMLKEAGINYNLAPCVDLSVNQNSIIEKKERSYSSNPKTVVKYAKQFIKAHHDNNILTSIKHFPGHGSSEGDTHLGFVDATGVYKDEEIYPYLELANIDSKQTVMISHIFNRNIDYEYPASLSFNTIQKYLRLQTDFKGVTITDDLNMGAIEKNYSLNETVVLAINAGENILLWSNRKPSDLSLPEKINYIIQAEVIDGNISIETLEESYNKVLKLKENL